MKRAPSERTTVKRRPARAAYDWDVIDAILDEALVAHLAFVDDGPVVVPLAFVRVEDEIVFHGARASRALERGLGPVSVCVTLLDGLVLARSAFHHSMNYRSVIVLGRPREVTGPEEKRKLSDALVEKLERGRAALVRPPNDKELAATRFLALSLTEASAKIRAGGPIDDEEDLALPVWAGHVPLALTRGVPSPDQSSKSTTTGA